MSFDPNLPVDVVVCHGKERGTKYPHWMLMLLSQNSDRGTWYHSVGGPTQNRPYEVAIEGGKRVNSHGIQLTELLGTITSKDVNKVKAAAKRVPAQQCQRYVVALVFELEKSGLLQQGQARRLNDVVQMSETAQQYAIQNPVNHPSGAYVPRQGQSGAGPSSTGASAQRGQSGAGPSSTGASARRGGPDGEQTSAATTSGNGQSSRRGQPRQRMEMDDTTAPGERNGCCCIVM